MRKVQKWIHLISSAASSRLWKWAYLNSKNLKISWIADISTLSSRQSSSTNNLVTTLLSCSKHFESAKEKKLYTIVEWEQGGIWICLDLYEFILEIGKISAINITYKCKLCGSLDNIRWLRPDDEFWIIFQDFRKLSRNFDLMCCVNWFSHSAMPVVVQL